MPRLPKLPLDTARRAVSSARRLTTQSSPNAGKPSAPPAAPPKTPAKHGRVGKYDESLVDLVVKRPGLTVAQAAAEIGVHPTALYPVIRRLEARGEVAKVGQQLHPATDLPGDKLERLWCEAGHHWIRRTVRGRKPRRCPNHS